VRVDEQGLTLFQPLVVRAVHREGIEEGSNGEDDISRYLAQECAPDLVSPAEAPASAHKPEVNLRILMQQLPVYSIAPSQPVSSREHGCSKYMSLGIKRARAYHISERPQKTTTQRASGKRTGG
jgi:hypothetical protein